jgi:hypothetical protein
MVVILGNSDNCIGVGGLGSDGVKSLGVGIVRRAELEVGVVGAGKQEVGDGESEDSEESWERREERGGMGNAWYLL